MSVFKRAVLCVGAALFFYETSSAQNQSSTISLNDLNTFKDPGKNWIIASNANADFNKPGDMRPVKGKGVILNINSPKNISHLITKEEFGDLELEMDFMMAKNSNSGVYLQGRYEVQLFDSWGKPNPTYVDCGGIYERWDENRDGKKGYEGIAPLMNTSRAPGLWQHLRIVFRAPKFNSDGVKTGNARFEEVYLNGALVQQQVEVTGPTWSGIFKDEKPVGSLMFQGDHGNVAFRNIKFKTPEETKSINKDVATPIIVNVADKPYFLRSFMNYGDKKLTHVISVGNPNQTNYSYDLSRGALIQIWRGKFADATDMWFERGEPHQSARPIGSIITLSDAPSLTVLSDPNASWPDSIPFDNVKTVGYVIDKNKVPTFNYTIKGVNVADKISAPDATTLTREITVENPAANLNLRVLSANSITSVGKGMYAINDKSYYIKLDEKIKPNIRQSGKGQELIIPIEKASTITYSIIW